MGLDRKNRSNSVSNPTIDSIGYSKSGGEERNNLIKEEGFLH